MTTISEYQAVRDEIREAVQSGADIHRKVKDITLKALTYRQLDMDSIKNVTDAVGHGINEGITTRGDQAKELFSQAISALDDALAIAAQASKLAIEEAASRASEYSRHDLNDAINNIRDMENLFLDALEKAAMGSSRIIVDIVGDFVGHARRSGTAVGKQALEAADFLTKLQRLGKDTVVSNTVAVTITLAQMASGMLSAMAESLQASHSKKYPP